MMPFCQYHKCKRVADTDKIGLLETWDTYHFRNNPTHTQGVWLCKKHVKKVKKLLGVEMQEEYKGDKG